MKIFRKTSSLGLAVMLAFGLAGTAHAQECVIGDWDVDTDAELTRDEFAAGFDSAGWFDDWDADGDGLLSEDEFGVAAGDWGLDTGALWQEWVQDDEFIEDDPLAYGLFDVWDEDDDYVLSCDEYNRFVGIVD